MMSSILKLDSLLRWRDEEGEETAAKFMEFRGLND